MLPFPKASHWIRTLFLLGLGTALHAQDTASAEAPEWIPDSQGCLFHHPDPSSAPSGPITLQWSGACENQKMQGPGTLEWFENQQLQFTYTGHLALGSFQGNGTLRSRQGESVVCIFRAGKPNGTCTITDAKGKVWTQNFKDGKELGPRNAPTTLEDE
jgi:hypothetical protein